VHEAWLRLAADLEARALPPDELVALSAHVMRRVLTDHARRRRAAKRDRGRVAPGAEPDELHDAGAALVVEVDRLLGELAERDAELARVVELRFFGGLDLAEIAAATGLSVRTVKRRWQVARSWLTLALEQEHGGWGR
jgi:RNA polymerase sigma factor (TIGR02999 family)